MSFIRELADFYRFFFKTAHKEKMIVFFTQHEGYYPNYEGLIEEMTGKQHLNICYISSDIHDPVFHKAHPKIKTFYIDKLMVLVMLFVKCKVFVMTLTDLNQLHYKRSINPVHYVYVFHSMVSTHLMYREGAFDHYDSILCVGPYQAEEIRTHETQNSLKPKVIVESGYYRLERIYKSYQNYKRQNHDSKDKDTVLIAPSWGDKNILESCGKPLVALLLEKGYRVIVRPHPETVRRSHKLIKMLKDTFDTHSDFQLELSVAGDDSLLRADVLICDLSGIALEYAFGTERPVLFIDVPYKIKNDNYRSLHIEPFELSVRTKIGVVISPLELSNVPLFIERLKSEQAQYQKQIKELREESVYAFGRSSEIGVKHIIDLLNEEQK